MISLATEIVRHVYCKKIWVFHQANRVLIFSIHIYFQSYAQWLRKVLENVLDYMLCKDNAIILYNEHILIGVANMRTERTFTQLRHS